MNTNIEKQNEKVVATLILRGDLSRLSPEEKVGYYKTYCERLGLDPFTKPFDILPLNGREVLYCTRSGAQQLNKLHQVSHKIISRETIIESGVYYVITQASLPDGRCTESIGAVNIINLKGDALANAIMKAETKSKRRSTLDLLGLGVLDESELDTIGTKDKNIVQGIAPNEATAHIIQDVTVSHNNTKSNEIKQNDSSSDELKQDVKSKRGRKKQIKDDSETVIDIQKPTDIESSVFERRYSVAEDIEMTLGLANTIGELKTLYFANQQMIENNNALKQQFSHAKNLISNGK